MISALRLVDYSGANVAVHVLVPERRLSNALKPAETAGVVGLKIAETLPAGRGSPHGCGLRAVIYRDVTSARPDSLTASVEGTAQRRFWLAGARGYRGRRRWAAPCALPALWETWGRETAGERNILRSKKISSTVATTKPYVTATGCNILRSRKISSAVATTKHQISCDDDGLQHPAEQENILHRGYRQTSGSQTDSSLNPPNATRRYSLISLAVFCKAK